MQKRIPRELKKEIYGVLEELVEQGIRNSPKLYGNLIRE